jgi:hypothetical protein
MSSLPPRRGAYCFDAPYAPILLALGGACLFALSAWNLGSGEMNSTPRAVSILAPGVAALWLFLNAGFFIYSTRVGKFDVWEELLDVLELKGDERLLDIGCGRGAVLLMAAQRLPRGRAVGIDVWSTKDQSGNAEQVTRQNAALEGVADRVELHTADSPHRTTPGASRPGGRRGTAPVPPGAGSVRSCAISFELAIRSLLRLGRLRQLRQQLLEVVTLT